MNTEIKESLIIGEFGDVRSMLDEFDSNGTTSIDDLNSLNLNATWSFNSIDGWGYDEV